MSGAFPRRSDLDPRAWGPNRAPAQTCERLRYGRDVSFASDDLTEFFESYGWQFERREGGLFRTGFVGESGPYEIWLKVTDTWVYFAINPYVARPAGRHHGSVTLMALLRANHELNLAKFAIDEDGDLSLSVELPLDGFCYEHFSDALTALAIYADDWRPRFDAALTEDAAEVV
jgi:Putative bacterial sensory transduction regulator